MTRLDYPFETAARVLRELEQRRLDLADEIRHYPTPIAGCDQHFNWLLERQQAVRRLMQQADAAVRAAESVADLAERLQELAGAPLPEEFYPHDTVHSHDGPRA